MKRVVVVMINWLGDTVFSLPVFHNLKALSSQPAVVALAVERIVPILKHCPDVDDVVTLPPPGPRSWFQVREKLRRQACDTALLLHRSVSRAALVWAAGVPRRIGDTQKARRWFLSQPVAPAPENIHRIDSYLYFCEAAGIPIRTRVPVLSRERLPLDKAEALLVSAGFCSDQPAVLLNIGGNWDLKRWPLEGFARLGERIVDRHNFQVVLTGTPKDRPQANALAQKIGRQVVNLAGRTDLETLMALMTRMTALISGDSGPLHIAAALGVPVVGLYGPTDPRITGVRSQGASMCLHHRVGCNEAPCYFLACPDNRCMKAIHPQEVSDALDDLLTSGVSS